MTLDPQALTAAAGAEARYDGYDDLLSFSKTTRERYIDRAGAAVTAYLAAAWQDISTAPKDRHVLLFSSSEGQDVGRWEPSYGVDGDWMDAQGYTIWNVTHWQSLPTTPLGSGRKLADANSNPPASP